MKILPTLLASTLAGFELHNTKEGSSKIEQICADKGLVVLTDENKDIIAAEIKGNSKYLVAGKDKKDRCTFIDRKGRVVNRRCGRKTKFVCSTEPRTTTQEATTTTTTDAPTTTTTTTAAPTTTTTTEEPFICIPAVDSPPLSSSEYRVVTSPNAAESRTWHEARDLCQEIGSEWDLAVFEKKGEYEYVRNIVQQNCAHSQNFWVGYKNRATVHKREAESFLSWAASSDSGARFECAQWAGEEMLDVPCKNYWTGVDENDVGVGYICERHSYADSCTPRSEDELPEDNRYFISESGEFTWDDARNKCQERGNGWDLAIIDDVKEHKKLVEMSNCASHAFWLGMTESGGLLTDIDGNNVLHAPWDLHSNPDAPEPNNSAGDETCIRMKGNVYNDAKCSSTNSGRVRDQNGMGYICEYDASKVITEVSDANGRSVSDYVCDTNLNVNPFRPKPGCARPLACKDGARLSIVDSWKVGQYHVNYGFAAKVTIPDELAKGSWSILIRFSNNRNRGNIQLWNAKFFNFYSNNNEILIQNKLWKNDLEDENSFVFIADNMNTNEYPELVTFRGRQSRHSCFQNRFHGARSGAASDFIKAVVGDQANSKLRTGAGDLEEYLMAELESVTRVRANGKSGIKVNRRRNKKDRL